jgi:hypothetical protein
MGIETFLIGAGVGASVIHNGWAGVGEAGSRPCSGVGLHLTATASRSNGVEGRVRWAIESCVWTRLVIGLPRV